MDDRPSTQIVKLGTSPWPIWSMKFRAILDSKNLGDVLEEPAEEDSARSSGEGAAAVPGRTAKDRQAKGLMLLAVDDLYMSMVHEAATSREAWTKLEQLHAGSSKARRAALAREWASLRQHQRESVQAFVQRVKTVATAMRSAGKDQNEEDITFAVLNGLDSTYTVLRDIFLEQTDATLEKCMPALLRREHEATGGPVGVTTGVRDGPTISTALTTMGRDGPTPPQLSRSGRPHYSTTISVRSSSSSRSRPALRRGGPGPSRGQAAIRQSSGPRRPVPGADGVLKPNVQCHNCHAFGHLQMHCPQGDTARAFTTGVEPAADTHMFAFTTLGLVAGLIDPAGNPLPQQRTDQLSEEHSAEPSTNITHGVRGAWVDGYTIPWVMDSGASHHMTPHRTAFVDFQPCTGQVKAYGGQHLPVEGIGRVVLSQHTPHRDILPTRFQLHDVLYCPSAEHSLLSISRAMKAGAGIGGDDSSLILYLPRTIGYPLPLVGHLNSLDLFICPAAVCTPMLGTSMLAAKATPEVWHRRFGHLGMENLMRLPSMVRGMELEGPAARTPCETCLESKQHKQPHPPSTRESHAPLELVHSDVCGPMEGSLSTRKSYFITLLDDFTGYSSLIPINSKGEASDAIMLELIRWSNACERSVKALRTDRGGEYVAHHLKSWLARNGIQHQLTAPYNPQANGKAERLNQTLLERGRALMQDAQLHISLWPYAFNTANMLRRVSPAKGKTKTPHELFHGSKPNISHLRAYGCAAYVMLEKHEQASKVSPVSQRGQLIGYDPAGYIILVDSKVKISPHVRFDEHNIPKRAQPSQQHLQNLAAPSTSELHIATLPDTPPLPPHLPPHLIAPQHAPLGGGAVPGAAPEPLAQLAPPAEPEAEQVQQPEPQQQELRRSTRERAQPAHLQGTYAPMGRGQWRANMVQQARAPLSTSTVYSSSIPENFMEAMQSREADRWLAAAEEEIRALDSNNTWTLLPTPPGVRPLPTKWVFSRKAEGERYKARLVAKGCAQRPGDYGELYTPVGRAQTVRAFLSRVAVLDLELHQLDFTTAFLNGELKEGEKIWVQQPEGFQQGGNNISCLLRKSLYGLKQAPRAWHETLSQALEKEGYKATEADPGLYTQHSTAGHQQLILVYVDDLLIASSSLQEVQHIKGKLLQRFKGRTWEKRRLSWAWRYSGIGQPAHSHSPNAPTPTACSASMACKMQGHSAHPSAQQTS